MLKYMKFLKNKVKKYDKAAKNPFYNDNFINNKKPSLLFDRTYIWIEKS